MRQSNTFKLTGVTVDATIKDTAKDIAINGRPFMIANSGAQPLYINPTATASAADGFLIPAGVMVNVKMTVSGNLSVISNATGTTVTVLFFDM
jgi:protein-disulfide isomerase